MRVLKCTAQRVLALRAEANELQAERRINPACPTLSPLMPRPARRTVALPTPGRTRRHQQQGLLLNPRCIADDGTMRGTATLARLAKVHLLEGVTLMEMQESGATEQESGATEQESGEDKDESLVERMEQAAQRAKEESGQSTDVDPGDQ